MCIYCSDKSVSKVVCYVQVGWQGLGSGWGRDVSHHRAYTGTGTHTTGVQGVFPSW